MNNLLSLHKSGLICLNWYDWNVAFSLSWTPSLTSSGLICLNWYDWNEYCTLQIHFHVYPSRDWSAWIDTIETEYSTEHVFTLTISRDWSAWIDTIETILNQRMQYVLPTGRDWSAWIDTIETVALSSLAFSLYWSGLICLNWYDWNLYILPNE